MYLASAASYLLVHGAQHESLSGKVPQRLYLRPFTRRHRDCIDACLSYCLEKLVCTPSHR